MPSIRSITSLGEVMRHVDQDTLVFLDVDETLLRAGSVAGSERWEKAFTQELVTLGVEADMAWRSSCFAWQAMQRVIPTVPCEGPETATAVSQLQLKALGVVGLTARHPALATETVDGLAAAGIALRGTSPKDGTLKPAAAVPHTPEAAEWAAWFRPAIKMSGGVAFCCGPRKLEAALAYLELLEEAEEDGSQPVKRVVLVDDRRSHLEQVGEGIEAHGRCEYVGFHLTHTEGKEGATAWKGLDETSQMLAKVMCSEKARNDMAVAMRLAHGPSRS